MSLLATLVMLASPAQAGGVGVIGLAATHTEKVYFYDESSNQYSDIQLRPTTGFGVEALLGDRDDRLIGLMKAYYFTDFQATADRVDTAAIEGDPTIPLDPDFKYRSVVVFTAGLQWGLWGDPTGLQINLITSLGTGAITPDSTEFMLVEVGPGVHYVLQKKYVLHAELVYHLRYRKSVSHGGGLNVGIRYYFD
jgi:hypothetical protein